MIVGLDIFKTPESLKFVSETEKRLNVNDVAKNPFRTNSIKKIRNDKITYIIQAYPIYPKFYKVAYVSFIVSVFFFMLGFLKTSIWGAVITLFFISTYYFFTDEFFTMISKKGLRKSGYDGKIKTLDYEQCIERLISWDNKKF